MKVYLAVVILCLLACGQVSGRKRSRHQCQTDVCRRQCPLLEVGSNIVTTAEFMSMIATGRWLAVYKIEIGTPPPDVTKNQVRWTTSGSSIFRETAISFATNDVCLNLTVTLSVTSTKCGVQLDQVEGGNRIERFYSQDLGKYVWWDLCIEPTNSEGGCDSGLFFLLIRDTRAVLNTGEINLDGLPWGKIAVDLKKVRNVDFEDSSTVQYIWIGPECLLP